MPIISVLEFNDKYICYLKNDRQKICDKVYKYGEPLSQIGEIYCYFFYLRANGEKRSPGRGLLIPHSEVHDHHGGFSFLCACESDRHFILLILL